MITRMRTKKLSHGTHLRLPTFIVHSYLYLKPLTFCEGLRLRTRKTSLKRHQLEVLRYLISQNFRKSTAAKCQKLEPAL